MLEVKNISFSYNSEFSLQNICFQANAGEITGLIGPNGSGKTTLFKVIDGLIKAKNGEICSNGENILNLGRKGIAKLVAVVPQLSQPPEGFSVFEMVSLGRYPYLNMFQMESNSDVMIVKNAIAEVGLIGLCDRDVSTLSGGEYQRVIIARALAQEPKVLLLDEPVSHLDIKFQIQILELLNKLKEDRVVIAAFHDLNLAAAYCDDIILLSNGKIFSHGRKENVLTTKNIGVVYDVDPKKVLHLSDFLIK